MTAEPAPVPVAPTVFDFDFEHVFELLPDGVCLAADDGRLVAANRALCDVAGRSRDELQRMRVTDLLFDEGSGPNARVLGSTDRTTRVLARLQRAGSESGPLEVEVTVSPLMSGAEARWLIVMHDVSGQVQAHRELEGRAAARTQELESMLKVARSASSSLQLEAVLDQIIEELKQVMDFQAIAISTNADGGTVVVRRGPGNLPVGSRMPGGYAALFREYNNRGMALVIDDVRGDSPAAHAYREMAGDFLDTHLSHVRSYISVPLRKGSGWFGSMTISQPVPGFYTEDDGRLLLAFADHVGLAIQNAALFEETQRRNKEMESLLDITRLTAELSDLPTVLDRIMDQLALVLPFRAMSIMRIEGDDARYLARRGPGAIQQGTVLRGIMSTPMGDLVTSRDSIVIRDVQSDSEAAARIYRNAMGPDGMKNLGHVRSWMGAAMRNREGLIGLLSVSWDEPDHYHRDQARLLAAFAGFAAIAIENSRLFEDSERRARQMEALHRADEALNRSLLLGDVERAMVDLAVELLGADGSVLYTWDAESGRRAVRAMCGFTEENERIIVERFTSIGGPPPDSLEIEIITDALETPGYDPVVVNATGVRGMVELPIMPGGLPYGVFAIGWLRPMNFSDADRQLFATLATRATVAIENARLFERVQAAASLEERQRLARELHDSVSQALYGIALGTRTARTWLDRDADRAREPLDYALSLAEVGMAEMRALIFELRPESLESEGLIAALGRHTAAISARYGIEVATDFDREPSLAPHVREGLYRIAQEAMHNVVKHAGASRIELAVKAADDATLVIVRDNGKGFDTTQDFRGHLGLKSMRERAEKFGGVLMLRSAPGTGTHIEVMVGRP